MMQSNNLERIMLFILIVQISKVIYIVCLYMKVVVSLSYIIFRGGMDGAYVTMPPMYLTYEYISMQIARQYVSSVVSQSW